METHNILLFLLPLEVDGSSARTRLTAVLSEHVEVLVDAELPAALRPVQIVYSLCHFCYYFAQTQKKTENPVPGLFDKGVLQENSKRAQCLEPVKSRVLSLIFLWKN